MGAGEAEWCALLGDPARFSREPRPRVGERVHPRGGGVPRECPDTAHLRESAPRSSAPKNAKRVRRRVDRDPGDAVRSESGQTSTHSSESSQVMEAGWQGSRVGVRDRNVGDREGHGCKVRGGRDPWSRSATGRAHGEAEGTREGRRVRIGSQIGALRSDYRAGSLVRRCKGRRDVVSPYEESRSR